MPRFNQKGITQLIPLLLILTGIIAGVYLIKNPTFFQPKASSTQMSTISDQLLDANRKLNNLDGLEWENQLAQLKFLAKQRQHELIKELANDPDLFIRNASLVDQLESFPEEIQPFIERRVNLNGKVMAGHADNPKDGRAEKIYTLSTADDFYYLHGVSDELEIQTGDEAEINSIAIGMQIAIAKGGSGFVVNSNPSKGTIPFDSTDFKLGVVLMKFKEEPENVVLEENIRLMVFGPQNSLSDYYNQNTFGGIFPYGDMLGMVEVEKGNLSCKEGHSYWKEQAEESLGKKQVNTFQYYSILYVFPPVNDCYPILGWGLVGKVFGSPTKMWLASYNLNNYFEVLTTITHEFGHNLRLNHASSVDCLSITKTCDPDEYGDIFDTLGSFERPYNLNAPHRYYFDFLRKKKESQDYANNNFVLPILLNSPDSYKKIVKISPLSKKPPENKIFENGIEVFPYAIIFRGNNVPVRFMNIFVEYRQPIGFDSFLPEKVTGGVMIHLSSSFPFTNTYLVLPEGSNSAEDAVLADDGLFYDPVSGIKIRQLSHDETGAIIEVTKD